MLLCGKNTTLANMSKRIREKVYPLLVSRMGENCINCGSGLFELKELGKQEILLIDHIDNNNSNNTLKNLQLLCRACNTKKNWNRETPEPNTRNIPLELRLAIQNKKSVSKYIYGRLNAENFALDYIELLDDLSAFIGNSQQANKNYIKTLCSRRHGMLTLEDRNGVIFLVPKNDEELDNVILELNNDE